MGLGKKSHGAKENKETQSPVLKIFKDIMQKETNNPEKITLLKDKQKEKKRKTFASRPKCDQKSYDSSSTERYRRMKQHKITVQGVKEEKNDDGSETFQGDKKESWCSKRDRAEKNPDDTCSCVSCALKKLIGSEYMCVACLLVLFSVSVSVAFLMVFRSSAVLDAKPEASKDLKKIQLIKRQLSEQNLDGKSWDTLPSSLPQYPGYLGSDISETKLRSPSSLDDLDGISSDLSSVLGSGKLAESQTSDRLRDFYKKLIQTDTQIKRLKESMTHSYQTDSDIKYMSERFKRSMDKINLKNVFKTDKDKVHNDFGEFKDNDGGDKRVHNKKRHRRSKENSTKLTGFVVEKEKFYIQYEPIVQRRNYPKCYHGHDGRSHEKRLKHPFYKNSQRVDEMLQNDNNEKTTPKDNYFSNSVYKDMQKPQSDPRYRIKNNDYIENDDDYNNMINKLNMTKTAKNFTDISTDYFENKQINIPQSTIDSTINSETIKTAPGRVEKKLQNDQVGRKLMQINNEDDETLSYDDLKEVLADDKETHDETDTQVERIKRKNENPPMNFKYNPSPGTYNPNWKGPMPLYPEEINAMIKQAALHNLNIQVPVDTKDMKIEKDKAERDISDTEYVEDYLDDKYSKLVNMAQAYSDYGVLDDKQDTNSATTKGIEKPNEGLRIFDGIRNGIYDRLKKAGSNDPEGLRFEYKPGTGSEKNDIKGLFDSVRKHIKIVNPCIPRPTPAHLKSEPELDKLYPPSQVNEHFHVETQSPYKGDKKVSFTLKIPSRSLKSLDEDDKVQTVRSKNASDIDLGEFFAMMAGWFFSMADLSGELKGNGTSVNDNVSDVTGEVIVKKNKSEVLYPMYDSEIIENIGHRSRVLMSFDDNITATEETNRTDATSSYSTDKVSNSKLTTINNTNTIDTTANDNHVKDGQNKTIVKRSIGNNFIFWNDLYDDDEYGMKVDYLDNIMRGKHATKYDYKGALLKSKDWVQEKFKSMTDKIREDLNQKWKMATEKKESKKPLPKLMPHKIVSYRQIRSSDNNNGEDDVGKTFAALNANLKHVCRQAAEAVRNTRKIEAHADNREASHATGLMQQLVRLMSDLVDIQVQQKTCAKLPPDLRDFLEWLTAPSESHPAVDNLPSMSEYNQMFTDGRFEKSTDFSYDIPTLTEDTHQEDRTECLGSIRAVQDLIQQYEGMTDEDKTKMSGVKEYLDNQLEFLNRKLNSLNEYNSFSYKKREVRNKRSLKKPRFRRLFDKYLFVKKHTSTSTTTTQK